MTNFIQGRSLRLENRIRIGVSACLLGQPVRFGGRGISAGRTRNTGFRPGDAFDFWRVLQADPPHRLHLLSEMKMPGDALLDINLVALGGDRCEIQLIALFLPKGLGGILYWNGFLPVHHILFRGMIEAVVRSAGKQLVNGPEQCYQ